MIQRLTVAILGLVLSSILLLPSAFAADTDCGTEGCPPPANTNGEPVRDSQTGFSNELLERAEKIRNQKVDLSQLPGPETGGLQVVLNAIIRLAVYMAGSVMLLLIVFSSFMLITGKKEAYEQFRTRLLGVFIGALLVFSSFIIVSAVWGIAW